MPPGNWERANPWDDTANGSWAPVREGNLIEPYVITTGCSSTVIEITSDWTCSATAEGMTWYDHSGTIDLATGFTTGNPCNITITRGTSWRTPTRAERRAEQRRNAKLKRKREAATKRARGLLRRHLTKRQRADYDAHGYFFMQTPKGHRYKIGSARDHNIIRLNRRGTPMRVLCASVYGIEIPLEDVLLAQKLFLEGAEDEFLEIANQWAVRTARGFPMATPRAA